MPTRVTDEKGILPTDWPEISERSGRTGWRQRQEARLPDSVSTKVATPIIAIRNSPKLSNRDVNCGRLIKFGHRGSRQKKPLIAL